MSTTTTNNSNNNNNNNRRLVYELTRDEERTLHQLRERLSFHDMDPEAYPPLNEEEVKTLQTLEDRFSEFELEGVRRLRMSNNDNNAVVGEGEEEEDFYDAQDSVLPASSRSIKRKVIGGTAFWGSLLATAVPGYVGRKLGITSDFSHWNWITDSLILGALPVLSKVGTSGAHLEKLAVQLQEASVQQHTTKTIGLVVSCLKSEEFEGYGVSALQFVKPIDWTQQLGVTNFLHLKMSDFHADVSFEELLDATVKIHDTIHRRNQCVYVHCKAGKGRSWVVTMCYLIAQEGLSFDDARNLVKSKRHQVSPGVEQVQRVRDFEGELRRQRHYLTEIRAAQRAAVTDTLGAKTETEATTATSFGRVRDLALSLPSEERAELMRLLQVSLVADTAAVTANEPKREQVGDDDADDEFPTAETL
eukprot:PhM_4_TR17473/c2_g1_i1/m.33059